MKVTFGTYPDNLGHLTSSGCFRCHDGSHNAKDGTSISADCEYLPQADRQPESVILRIHRIQEIPNWTSLELAPGL